MNDTPDLRTVREILVALSRDLGLLFEQTVQIARAELRTATSALWVSLAWIVAGVAVLLAGLLVLISALVLIAIALGLPAWGAALTVGVGLMLAGAAVIWIYATKLRGIGVTLPETRNDVQQTIAWLKEQTRT